MRVLLKLLTSIWHQKTALFFEKNLFYNLDTIYKIIVQV